MKFLLFDLLFYFFTIPFYAQEIKTSPKDSKPTSTKDSKQINTLHIGFFPNLTHPQALVAQALTRKGEGWFERYLPNNVSIQWHRFYAGPSAMESLITGTIDLSYVGPSPAINLYTRTSGNDIRLLSGAVKGGSGLVLQNDISINTSQDWKDRKIATPQFGNTQDIACRNWFAKQSIKDIILLPASNPDQLMLFKRKQIDGAWTIEPWLSRLINEGNGKLFFSDDTQWTTILVCSQAFCHKYNPIKKAIVEAHEALTVWIKNNIKEAADLIHAELKTQTHLDFSCELIEATLKKLQLCTTVPQNEIQLWLDDAVNIGFIKPEKNISLDKFFSEVLHEEVSPKSQEKQALKLSEESTKKSSSCGLSR
ncbi:MAG: ABC transporter substrate-binding protein [Alphaproteobacteria bacterium]|nr:ABC transporter substrate-binding protein [Alphaproteobacteria bacterium]